MKAPLAAKLAEARALYPELGITEEGFLDAVLRLEDNGASIEHCPDLLLASACARGEAPALLAFERFFGPDVDRAIDKSPRLGIDREEFRQLLRARLFVAEGERPPRITGYRGEGALRSWVRVTAGRLVIDLSRRHHDSERPDDDLARRLATAGDDPELDYLRHAYAEALPSAFAEAVERLTVRQRNLLRQRFLQELTVERLASIYGVHRSTMFEWLAGARESMLKELRAALARRLPEQNLDSVLALMGSQLELSVRRMLDSRLERDENT